MSGVELQIQPSLSSTLDLGKWSGLRPSCLNPRKVDPTKCGDLSMSILHPLTQVQIYSSEQTVF
jgi:hypothetical protein